MAGSNDIALMAHLLRRASFNASRDEIEAAAARGYDTVVGELLHPAPESVPSRLTSRTGCIEW